MSPEQGSIVTSSAPNAASARHQLPIVAPRVPGPRGWFSGWPLLSQPLPFLENNFREYGDLVHLRLANFHIYVVAHPDGIKHVLQDNHRNYRKSVDYKLLARLLGQGLVTSEGELWLGQRRLMQPMFHRQKTAAFGAMMTE